MRMRRPQKRGKNFRAITNHLARRVKRRASAAELAALFVVVSPVEHVPLAAARDHPLGHARARQLVEALVERETVGEDALRLTEEETLASDFPEFLRGHRLQEGVREEREAGLGE